MLRCLLPVSLATLLVSPGYSQSLGEAAAREKAKRDKKGPSSTRVITGEDLKAGRPPGQKTEPESTETPSSTEGSSRGEGSSRPPSDVPEGSSSTSGSSSNEAAWRQRAKQQRDAIASAQAAIQTNQARLSRLMADLEPVGLGDPNRLQTIENMKVQARQAIENAQRDLAAAQKAQQDLEDEARRNNIPPGWLR